MSQLPGEVDRQDDGVPTPSEHTEQDGPNVRIASAVIRVANLRQSMRFYGDVFGFHVIIHEHDVALLSARSGFLLYLNSIDPSRRHDLGTIGVEFLLWTADSQAEFDQIVGRLREHDPAVFVHAENEVTFVEACDPDRVRVVVAYPSPDRLPRQVIASLLRG